jgi:hypothetical protein
MVSVLLFIVALPIVFNSAFTSNVVGNDLNNPNELLCLDGWAEGAHAMIAGKRLIR